MAYEVDPNKFVDPNAGPLTRIGQGFRGVVGSVAGMADNAMGNPIQKTMGALGSVGNFFVNPPNLKGGPITPLSSSVYAPKPASTFAPPSQNGGRWGIQPAQAQQSPTTQNTNWEQSQQQTALPQGYGGFSGITNPGDSKDQYLGLGNEHTGNIQPALGPNDLTPLSTTGAVPKNVSKTQKTGKTALPVPMSQPTVSWTGSDTPTPMISDVSDAVNAARPLDKPAGQFTGDYQNTGLNGQPGLLVNQSYDGTNGGFAYQDGKTLALRQRTPEEDKAFAGHAQELQNNPQNQGVTGNYGRMSDQDYKAWQGQQQAGALTSGLMSASQKAAIIQHQQELDQTNQHYQRTDATGQLSAGALAGLHQAETGKVGMETQKMIGMYPIEIQTALSKLSTENLTREELASKIRGLDIDNAQKPELFRAILADKNADADMKAKHGKMFEDANSTRIAVAGIRASGGGNKSAEELYGKDEALLHLSALGALDNMGKVKDLSTIPEGPTKEAIKAVLAKTHHYKQLTTTGGALQEPADTLE